MIQKKTFGLWSVQFDTKDGARLGALSYDGNELLMGRSELIQLPKGNFGKFETRPVYGYDDCFPTVDPAVYPGLNREIPDHGELCWLAWEVHHKREGLRFLVQSELLPVQFVREMIFRPGQLIWNFEIRNKGNVSLPFQHVMHALLPLGNIRDIRLPEFDAVLDDIENKSGNMKSAQEVRDHLLSTPEGNHHMLFLQRIETGNVKWEYSGGLTVEMIFDRELFPSLGIWWNNHAYPGEDNCRRTTCAFEPAPGYNTNLGDAYKDGVCLTVEPWQSMNWRVVWNIGNSP